MLICSYISKPEQASAIPRLQHNPQVTCFLCGKKGHKSPDCPEIVSLSTKSGRPVKGVSTPEATPNSCAGLVNNKPIIFTIDSGATISVIPQELVSEVNGSGTVVVVDVNGGSSVRLRGTLHLHQEVRWEIRDFCG